MPPDTQSTQRILLFQQAIHRFIAERRDAKLKDSSEDSSNANKYEPTTWMQDAAKRSGRIQLATHTPKSPHSSAKGTALHCPPAQLHHHALIGTHSLSNHADDVVGDAAALDVNKFLNIQIDGKCLFDWLLADDANAIAALHPDPAIAHDMADAFKDLIRTNKDWASHPLAKQVYWWIDSDDSDPADNSCYHLLQPMFSSSFAHALYADIQACRFGQDNATARKARRDNIAHGTPYLEYKNLVIRKQGGSKPQNISQLTSERAGVNYLLNALPPKWDASHPKTLLGTDSCLPRLKDSVAVRELIRDLIKLLQSNPKPTMETRQRREAIEQALGAELAAYGAQQRAQLPAGWTRNTQCQLARCEQLWLDSERAALVQDIPEAERTPEDQAFISEYHQGNWLDQVATRFAHWVNTHLRKDELPVGDSEAQHWARQAVVDASWPTPLQRRLSNTAENTQDEAAHV